MSVKSSIAASHTYSTDMEESKFLVRNRSLHVARIALSSLLFIFALAVLVCEAVPYRHYKDTVDAESSGLALWPNNFDTRPTIAALSCGCVIAALNLVYVVIAVIPSPHPRIRLLNSCALASAFSGFLTALVGIVFMIYRPSATYPSGYSQNETLHSWTCKWSRAGDKAPTHFNRDCHDTRAGFSLLCVLLGLEIFMGVAAIASTWFQRGVSRRREEQYALDKLEIMTKESYREQ
ncbi:hypothetical protein N7462_006116 [Penicillium macrosclerotiorum]|uniref:uncharacterized protein n=1 Tax=Penicillium macrosclerotiorum TaxID=303699 RepID=UPI00254842D7|nr:uncharacterized protein N7462_006116 [Penicillium macrosclerotiorum]KAJ5682951.1 hypothetical protein N7462_006116 [Penicillium macrosclerotiorum]